LAKKQDRKQSIVVLKDKSVDFFARASKRSIVPKNRACHSVFKRSLERLFPPLLIFWLREGNDNLTGWTTDWWPFPSSTPSDLKASGATFLIMLLDPLQSALMSVPSAAR
jgi:hypothetical protein